MAEADVALRAAWDEVFGDQKSVQRPLCSQSP
jgi:hypothetical protein